LSELREVVLVTEGQLDAAGGNPSVAADHLLDRASHPVREYRIDRRRSGAWPLPRAGPLRTLLRRPNREASPHDLAREPTTAFLVGDGENGTRMSLGQLPALDHPENIVGKLEQT